MALYTAPRKNRRRKRGAKLLVSYLIRGAALLLVVLCTVGLVRIGTQIVAMFTPSAPGEGFVIQGKGGGQEDGPSGPQGPDVSSLPPAQPVQVVIDAGHGGIDPGCTLFDAQEKDITIAVALHLQRLLTDKGVQVLLTRTKDEDIGLGRRTELANGSGASYLISLHCNSYEQDSSVRGLECYYCSDEAAHALAQDLTDQFQLQGVRTREIKQESYQILRDTQMPAVLIEMGFMTNREECLMLQSEEFQQTVAAAVASVLLEKLGIS